MIFPEFFSTWQVGIEAKDHSEAGNWWPRWWQHWRKIVMQRLPSRWPSALTCKATSSQKLILKMCISLSITPIWNSKISFSTAYQPAQRENNHVWYLKTSFSLTCDSTYNPRPSLKCVVTSKKEGQSKSPGIFHINTKGSSHCDVKCHPRGSEVHS